MGVGEQIVDLEVFHPERIANRILGMGDIVSLVEKASETIDHEKAEEIADLAMEKMPVDLFGFYTLLEPYIGAYYELEATEKARKLYMEVSEKYQESLTYYSTLSEYNQSQ